jgi:hypothetical protein
LGKELSDKLPLFFQHMPDEKRGNNRKQYINKEIYKRLPG